VSAPANPTIGVFDSGFGGLTVLRAMVPRIPGARWLYLGDTARLPYGSKSKETVARYAVSAIEYLQQQGADFLVIACNTASALALDEIRAAASVPVLGVIETGVAAAVQASRSRNIIVLGTTATIASHAYARACEQAGLHATEKACPLLVPLVEEGWIGHDVTEQVVRIYLDEAAAAAGSGAAKPDTILLGCTHYPLLREVFAKHAPSGMTIVDSAEVTAARAAELLAANLPHPATNKHRHPEGFSPKEPSLSPAAESNLDAQLKFFVTDSPRQFQSLGERFLGQPIRDVTQIALPE
jgi:glutamate racemase